MVAPPDLVRHPKPKAAAKLPFVWRTNLRNAGGEQVVGFDLSPADADVAQSVGTHCPDLSHACLAFSSSTSAR